MNRNKVLLGSLSIFSFIAITLIFFQNCSSQPSGSGDTQKGAAAPPSTGLVQTCDVSDPTGVSCSNGGGTGGTGNTTVLYQTVSDITCANFMHLAGGSNPANDWIGCLDARTATQGASSNLKISNLIDANLFNGFSSIQFPSSLNDPSTYNFHITIRKDAYSTPFRTSGLTFFANTISGTVSGFATSFDVFYCLRTDMADCWSNPPISFTNMQATNGTLDVAFPTNLNGLLFTALKIYPRTLGLGTDPNNSANIGYFYQMNEIKVKQ